MEAGAVEKLAELLKADDGLERDRNGTRFSGNSVGDGKKWENLWKNVGKTMEFMGKLGNPEENGASTGKKSGHIRKHLENMWR